MSSGSEPEVGEQDAYPVLNEDGTSNPHAIGKYRIERKLGSGGMGTVYLAIDTELRRQVALKVLPRERSQNPIAVKRFRAEAQAAANLKHDNIVAVYESGQSDGHTFIAMEFVDGIDVHDLVQRREVIPVKRSINIVKQVAAALQHANERGIVHRDIKPSNLLIKRNGTVKVADLGLARSMDDASDAGITRDGTTVGTVDYMSPEQARNSRKADVRSDIYSLGCTWYHMLTGEPPYAEGGLTERLRAHAAGQPPDPREINPKVPAGIVAILARMMAKNPDERYSTPKAFLEDLAQANLTKDKAAATVLAALDQEATTSSGKETAVDSSLEAKRPSKMPSRDPILGVSESQATVVIPYQLIGTVVACVAAFALAIYGIVHWGPSWGEEGTTTDQSDNLIAADNPFADDVAEHAGAKGKRGSASDKKQDKKKKETDTKVAGKKDEGDSKSTEKFGDAHTPLASGDRHDVQRQYIPLWAAQATRSDQPQGLTQTVVGDTESGQSQFSLQQAIKSLPREGGVITLPGSGPYVFSSSQITGRERVIIRAGSADRPLIGLRQVGDASAILDIKGGTLELSGVDIVALTAESASPTSVAAVRVSDGNLIVRDCSLTVSGESAARVIGFRVQRGTTSDDQDEAGPTQVLITQTAILGPNLTALSVDAEVADIVVSNSLFFAGTASALHLEQNKQSLAEPQRYLRMVGCTVVSGRTAMEIAASRTKRAAIPTEITAVGSLFSTYERSNAAALLTMTKKAKRKGSLDGLRWRSVGSAYQGWPRLIVERKSDQDKVLAANFASWQAIWGEQKNKKQFHEAPWPSAPPLATGLVSLDPFSLDSLPNNQAEALVKGTRPGCLLDSLHLGDGSLVERLHRPQAPVRTGGTSQPFKDARRIPLDLNRRDLGSLLRKPDLPNPVVIVATGSGLRKFTPSTIKNKSVRIEFRQKQGEARLKLQPSVPKLPKQKMPTAMFSVSGGRLQIVNGNFGRTPGSSVARTPWLLDVEDGEFLLQHCHIMDPPGGSRAKGLIRWRHNEDTGGNRHESHIRNSFLAGDGALIEADMRGQVLFTNNSVLASLADLFVLDLRQATSEINSSLVLEHSTFSAGNTLFKVETTEMPTPPKSPLGIFAHSNVLGAPVRSPRTDTNPVLMRLKGAAVRQRQVVWFGESNGYADEIGAWLDSGEGGIAEKQSFDSQWRGLWGPDNVRNPLTEAGGVLFAKPLPALHELTPTKFELHKNASGRTWDEKKRPIGAKIKAILFDGQRRAKRSSSTSGQKKKTTPRRKSDGF